MPLLQSSTYHTLDDISASTNVDDYSIVDRPLAEDVTIPFATVETFATSLYIASNEDDGIYGHGFVDSYYYHIWVIPKYTDLGAIVANQIREVELWNSHFVEKTFTDFTYTGDISVDGIEEATMNPLQSFMYTVSIPVIGSPRLIAVLTWFFEDAEAPTFTGTIVGIRVVPFTLRHNWEFPVIEQLSFKTDVLTGGSGKEQRLGLRQVPRRRIEMSYRTLDALERSYVESVLAAWQRRKYAVPFWPDLTILRTPVSAGATVFDIDTPTRDFEAGALLFITDGLHTDTLEIIGVTDDTVTTATGCLNSYPNRTKVVPARLGFLESKVPITRHTNHYEDIKLVWNLDADQVSTTRREDYTPELHYGIEVFDLSNNYSSAINIEQYMREDLVDDEIGYFDKSAIENFSRRMYPFSNLLTRAELPAFIEFIYRRKGKLTPVWYNERVPMFFLAQNALAAETNLIVTSGGYTQFLFESESRRDIAIRTSAGWKYRRITGAVMETNGTETLTLDEPLGVDVYVDQNPLMSLLKFVRLDSDTVELSYESSAAIRGAMPFVDLLTNV